MISSEKKQTGISGKTFLVVVVALAGLMFAAGSLISPLTMPTAEAAFAVMWKIGIVLAMFLVGTSGLSIAFFYFVLDSVPWILCGIFRQNRNDSYAITLAGIGLSVALILQQAPGADTVSYIGNVLMGGAVSILISALVTTLIAIIFGLRSLDEFRDWFRAADNNNYAFLVNGSFLAVTMLVMKIIAL